MNAELNSERRAKFAWGFAGFMAVAIELVALVLAFYPSPHFEFRLRALLLVPIAAVPWLAARQILRKYQPAAEDPTSETMREEFSFRLGMLVVTAYAMCMVAVSLAG